jgi:hypothetical protein
MSNNFRAESRKEWNRPGIGVQPSTEDLNLGCLQRIADATELMAKRYDELINAKRRAEENAEYYEGLYRRADRRVSAAKGQITKLKKLLAARTTGSQS